MVKLGHRGELQETKGCVVIESKTSGNDSAELNSKLVTVLKGTKTVTLGAIFSAR